MKNLLQNIIVLCILLSVQNVWAEKQSNVTTPKGSTVIAWIREEMSSSDIIFIENTAAAQYPNAEKLAAASQTYNCHGYAWHMTEGGSNRWIGVGSTSHEDIYMTDGSYTEVTSGASPRKISYQSDDHSAVSTDQAGVFISKWGAWPLMRHASNYCPYNSSSLRYYIKTSLMNIQGLDALPSNAQTTYTLPYTPVAPITWSVSSNIQIVSGQGTRSIIVKGTGIWGNGYISVKMGNNNASIFKDIAVGVPDINQVELSIGGNSNMLYAYHTNRNECIATYRGTGTILEYEWEANGWEVFNPLTSNKSKIYLKATYLPANTIVNIKLRARNSVGWSNAKLFGANVSNSTSGSTYKINTTSNGIVTIVKNEEQDYSLIQSLSNDETNGFMEYGLYNLYTGSLVAKGTISRKGGSLDFSNISNGFYVFSLFVNSEFRQTIQLSIRH